jgi:hypothetical protein
MSHFITRERDLLAYIDFQKRVNSQSRKLVTSLICLRSDIISEMRHRGGEWMSPNSRTVMWTLEAVLLTLEKCLNCATEKQTNVPPRNIHSAPPGGRTDNSMLAMSDGSCSVTSYELDYVQAGTALHMPRVMKTLLKSPVTCRISKEPALPDYDIVDCDPGEWNGYDECGEPDIFRQLFGRVISETNEDEDDLSRRAWNRETLNGGVNRGVLFAGGYVQGNADDQTDRILLVRPGGMHSSPPGKSSLKPSRAHQPERRSRSATTHVPTKGEVKRAVVSFTPRPGATLDVHQTDQYTTTDSPEILRSDIRSRTQNPEDADTEEDYMICHRKIEPSLPVSRKPGVSPRRPPQQRYTVSGNERMTAQGGRISPETKRIETNRVQVAMDDKASASLHAHKVDKHELPATASSGWQHHAFADAGLGKKVNVDLDSDDETSQV